MASDGFRFTAVTTSPSTFTPVPSPFSFAPATSTLGTSVSSTEKEAKKPQFKIRPLPEERSVFAKPLAPWRRVKWTEEERISLLERLSSYTPSSRHLPQARVLLLGPVGSGKSCFISSVLSMFDGRVTTRAMVGGDGSSSFTRKLRSFPLRAGHSSEGRSSALVLCDMMGFGDGAQSGPSLQDMLSVIRGHAPEGYEFKPDQALSSDTSGYIKNPSLTEQMHCVAFVLDASKVCCNSYSKGISDTFRHLRRNISDMGVHQVVLLTHIDKICPVTAKDTSSVYDSTFVREMIYKAAKLVGISASSVVPVKNYWCELDLDLSSDVLLLSALDHILQYTELLFTERDTSTSTDKL